MNYPLILLVGMHRSGTSLAALLLQALGIRFPGELLSGDNHNPDGYSERQDVSFLQEELLISLGRYWPSEAGCLPLPQNWLDLPCTKRCMSKLRQILYSESITQNGSWSIKDPRTSLLLKMWLPICEELCIPLKLVHATRDPEEVVRSLIQRDLSSVGMTEMRAQKLWWLHQLSILEDSLDLPRYVCNYSNWFNDNTRAQLIELGVFCTGTLPSTMQIDTAQKLIKSNLRRSDKLTHIPVTIDPRLKELELLITDKKIEPSKYPLGLITHPQFSGLDLIATSGEFPVNSRIEVFGYSATSCHWSIHAWLQRCNLPKGFNLSQHNQASEIGMHFQSVDISIRDNCLDRLRSLQLVLDSSIQRVQQLRSLGVNAFWLDTYQPSSFWLDSQFDPELSSKLFGLPHPQILYKHGSFLCLGSPTLAFENNITRPFWIIPSFAEIHVSNSYEARILAGWLNACSKIGLQIVRLNPTDYERDSNAFAALDPPICPSNVRSDNWLPALLLDNVSSVSNIIEEYEWHLSHDPSLLDCRTPAPEYEILCDYGDSGSEVSVCISLYNYADKVLRALESVLDQTYQPLELIIVDDCSIDHGDKLVLQWIEVNVASFKRISLLQHHENSGLAAARNTAFKFTDANWCFVLDADNSVDPYTIELCLAVAESSPPSTAVIHPLVAVVDEDSFMEHSYQPLLTRIPWQRQSLINGNQIDAMALIRRSHWQEVGGYTHIPGGWEDYDFWCKLIEAGYHGVLCPQRLGTYIKHSSSMQATSTNPNLAKLKRILMARHPWLYL